MHPSFWPFLDRAIKMNEYAGSGLKVLVITNGSKTAISLRMARLCEDGVINAVLSQDQWHDPIDPKVVRAYERLRDRGRYVDSKYGLQREKVEGTRTNEKITPHGSALANRIYTETPGTYCCCEDMLIYPDGKIFGCGCRKVRFGDVYYPRIPEDFEDHCCAVEQQAEQRRLRQEEIESE